MKYLTRINCVPPSTLTRQHLIAEYRELPRIFGLVRAAVQRGERPGFKAPDKYTLGTGHCRFFYSRLEYLSERHAKIVQVMKGRGYSSNYQTSLKEVNKDIPDEWWGTWEPDAEAISVNKARIAERLGKAENSN